MIAPELMGHVEIPQKIGKNLYFTEDVLSTRGLFLIKVSLLVEEKEQEHRLHAAQPFLVKIQMKKNPVMIFPVPKKVHYYSN